MLGQGQDCRGLFQAVATTVIGAEDNPMLGPDNGRIVELEPGHAEDDRVMAEAGNVELDVFRVGADLELDGQCFLGESTGGDGASIDNFEFPRHGFGL
jgi:hypothetical protein